MASARRLVRCLDNLVAFLRNAPDQSSKLWIGMLEAVREGILDANGSPAALRELESYFGGMGSLNDLVFCSFNGNLPVNYTEARANEEFETLLDRCFRELRLYDASLLDRVHWRWLEWRHRGELPARVKNAFSRRAV